MLFKEEDLLPLSAIQHLLFCERQCAFNLIEQIWSESLLTAQGRSEHRKVDSGIEESRADLRILRGLALRSQLLGLSGKTDVVELRTPEPGARGTFLPGIVGEWVLFPIEYKHGRPKNNFCDQAQLCAQAICLEEMLGATINSGALFYQAIRRRQPVEFDLELRMLTEKAAVRLHELFSSGLTPPAVNDKRCKNCSIKHLCLPDRTDGRHSASKYIQASIRPEA